MTFPYRSDVRLALSAIRSTKTRSLMTILGIVIGVVSVVSVVAIAQGVKHQISGQIDHLGKDLITVRPAQSGDQNTLSTIIGLNPFSNSQTINSLTPADLNVIKNISGVQDAVPLTAFNDTVTVSGQKPATTLIIGSNDQLPDVLNQSMAFGTFFGSAGQTQYGAVIGQQVATQLFGEAAPLGHSFEFRGQQFVVDGVFNTFDTVPFTLSADFNDAIFVPESVVQSLTNNTAPIYEILVKPQNPNLTNQLSAAIKSGLLTSHNGQNDFSVLLQSQSITVTNSVLNLLTKLIVGIAAISLVVGGIGIMNIMLVSVTERTREIGIRKAIGATNRQILNQFLIEAIVLSISGGIIGIILSFAVDYLIRVFSNLQPLITWQIVVLATAVALVIGAVFGALPAIQAARKDPIDSLRYE